MKYTRQYYIMAPLLLLCVLVQAQGKRAPDYRTDKESLTRVKNKIMRKELAAFTLAGGQENEIASDLKEVGMKQTGAGYDIFNSDTVRVSIQTAPFAAAKHKLSFFDSTLIKIDDKPFWGTSGEIPSRIIFSVQVTVGGQVIEVPYTALSDLYNPNLCWTDAKNKGTECRTGVYISNDSKRIYITMLNGDNGGKYEVTWIIENNKYLRRVIDYQF